MHITLNGEPYPLEPGLTLAQLVRKLTLDPRQVAIERNLEIVPRAAYDSTALSEGDRVEIVRFIGGG